METLCDVAKLAAKILRTETDYITNRDMIDDLFKSTANSETREITRLVVIDSFYSTNMGMRLYGLSDLVIAFKDIGSDDCVRKSIGEYLNSGNGKIADILEASYGIKKSGEPVGKARSLISKYLYFLSEHKFPIEDSFVKTYVNPILTHFDKPVIEIDDDKISRNLADRCVDIGCSVDEMDNLLWLFGKLRQGSLSLVVKKELYLKIITTLKINKNLRSKGFSEELGNKLIEDRALLSGLISDDLMNFLDFCSVV